MNKHSITITLVLLSLLISVLIASYYMLVNPMFPIEFEYKKHDYIYFPGKGIIHSPECKQCTLTFETI